MGHTPPLPWAHTPATAATLPPAMLSVSGQPAAASAPPAPHSRCMGHNGARWGTLHGTAQPSRTTPTAQPGRAPEGKGAYWGACLALAHREGRPRPDGVVLLRMTRGRHSPKGRHQGGLTPGATGATGARGGAATRTSHCSPPCPAATPPPPPPLPLPLLLPLTWRSCLPHPMYNLSCCCCSCSRDRCHNQRG